VPAQLNHTIVNVRDADASAQLLTEILGLPAPTHWGPFTVVEAANGASLDFITAGPEWDIAPQHYAFLVTEPEFDEIFGRILDRGLEHWADPHRQEPGQINHHEGGRGVYWEDPDGHLLEILTVPYGGWPT
jgi:catechol 2,3-dioxygenase-like lactoylglutathione lyase family enzyme